MFFLLSLFKISNIKILQADINKSQRQYTHKKRERTWVWQ